jgi:hypothetical protein
MCIQLEVFSQKAHLLIQRDDIFFFLNGINRLVFNTIFSALSATPSKKVCEFPVPSRDVTTKLSQGGNNDVITELFLPRGSLVSDIPAGDGKLVNLFLRCIDYS